jgi:hypothetical protein
MSPAEKTAAVTPAAVTAQGRLDLFVIEFPSVR